MTTPKNSYHNNLEWAAAELLAMGIKMMLHIRPDQIFISIELKNAYNAMWRATILGMQKGHMTLRMAVPYRRAKLGPRSAIWAEDFTLWGDDGL